MKNNFRIKWENFKLVFNTIVFSFFNSNNREIQLEINNKSKRKTDEAIQYTINTVKEIIGFLPNKSHDYLWGKTILEIGSGQDIGIALVLMGLGVKKAYLIDPFFAEWKNEIHLNYYKELLKAVKVEFPNHSFEALNEVCKIKSYNIKEIAIVRSGLENAKNIPDNEIDISFSNACFEHFL